MKKFISANIKNLIVLFLMVALLFALCLRYYRFENTQDITDQNNKIKITKLSNVVHSNEVKRDILVDSILSSVAKKKTKNIFLYKTKLDSVLKVRSNNLKKLQIVTDSINKKII
jgi:hypothetical protein